MNTLCIGTIPNSCLRVLQCVLAATEAGKTITVRDIARLNGWKSTNTVQQALRRLRNAGLVDFEERLCGTIQATCYFVHKEVGE